MLSNGLTKTLQANTLTQKLDNFLAASSGEAALPLLITHSQDQLQAVASYLASKGFAQPTGFGDFLQSLSQTGSHFSILAEPSKALYDAITQYPMGQIQLTRSTDLSPLLITPNYDSNRLLLITAQHLDHWQAVGYNLSRSTGLSLHLEAEDK
jgi:hypothetical protein